MNELIMYEKIATKLVMMCIVDILFRKDYFFGIYLSFFK